MSIFKMAWRNVWRNKRRSLVTIGAMTLALWVELLYAGLVLADEPTANVDSDTAEMLMGIMEELNRDRGVTFIFSTHDPRVMEHARRLVRLVDGKVKSDERRD